jgi:hypothetical protein
MPAPESRIQSARSYTTSPITLAYSVPHVKRQDVPRNGRPGSTMGNLALPKIAPGQSFPRKRIELYTDRTGPPLRLIFTHIFGWIRGAEVRNSALSLGERVANVASQVRGYLVMSARLIPPRRASDPSPGPRPDEVHRDRGPPSPLGRGQRPSSVPFSSGNGQKTEVGPPCPSRDVGQAQLPQGKNGALELTLLGQGGTGESLLQTIKCDTTLAARPALSATCRVG